MTLNEQLKKLYCDHIPCLEKFVAEVGNEDYVAPLLIRCWEEDYSRAQIRVMYYGQETNGWCGNVRPVSTENIERILKEYSEFDMGSHYNSLFWRYVHDLHNKTFNANANDNGFIWNNVLKFGKSGSGAPSMKVQTAEVSHFNVMRKEIDILRPHIVVFLSGPNYDDDIAQRLGGARFEKWQDVSPRQFALVKSDGIGCLAVRTYHPKYLNLNPKLGATVTRALRQMAE